VFYVGTPCFGLETTTGLS